MVPRVRRAIRAERAHDLVAGVAFVVVGFQGAFCDLTGRGRGDGVHGVGGAAADEFAGTAVTR